MVSIPIMPLHSRAKATYEDKATKVTFDILPENRFDAFRKRAHGRGHEVSVIGYFHLDTVKESDADSMVVTAADGDKKIHYLLHEITNESSLYPRRICGYVYLGENRYAACLKSSHAPIILLAFILTACIATAAMPKNNLDINPGMDIVEEVKEPEKESVIEEVTEIPVYTNVTITEEKPYVNLINPKGNTVYFDYELSEGDAVIYRSGPFPENRMVQADLSKLSKGNHILHMNIYTYDMDSETACSGATQSIQVSVE